MNYFKNCQDLDTAKNLFKKLCFELHPDTSGYNSESDFIKMYKEFKQAVKNLKNNTTFESDKNFNSEAFYNIVQKFNGLENININFIGSFIWLTDVVSGAMYQQKETIKAIVLDGYNVVRWANKKKSWYFSPKDYKQKFSKNKSLDQLKQTYKSNTVTTKQRYKIN